jgi:cytochrome c oxidase assembly protein subunit 15
MESQLRRDHRWVTTWLLIGVVMVLVQIMLGGVTRLTGSGLSITKWEIVTGILPPLTETDWISAFDEYKLTPQYQQINEGMSMGDFKFIFFWEYIHRLWARVMGFVFLIPFVWFLFRGSLSKQLIRRLLVVVALAGLAAIFGWIMVASGLISRPWVSAYKLTIHLSLGIALFVFLFYTWVRERGYTKVQVPKSMSRLLALLFWLVILQILLGGLVSGMKAALNYPTWPMMRGMWVPEILLDGSHWNVNTFLFYEQSDFMPALVQFLHRNTAYLIAVIALLFSVRILRNPDPAGFTNKEGFLLLGIIVVQVLLGIFTLIESIGAIPVYLGAAHQVVGILLLTTLVFWRLRTLKTYTNT